MDPRLRNVLMDATDDTMIKETIERMRALPHEPYKRVMMRLLAAYTAELDSSEGLTPEAELLMDIIKLVGSHKNIAERRETAA